MGPVITLQILTLLAIFVVYLRIKQPKQNVVLPTKNIIQTAKGIFTVQAKRKPKVLSDEEYLKRQAGMV
jgi:hypothetical protein